MMKVTTAIKPIIMVNIEHPISSIEKQASSKTYQTMKPCQPFEFDAPLLPGSGSIHIAGTCYRDPREGFDIDNISLNGANILPVMNWLGDGSVNEVDKIYNLACGHCRYLRMVWGEGEDETTDNKQEADYD